ncbi:MAG: HAD-IIIA family hydrolase [Elusimicrobiota bacterium]
MKKNKAVFLDRDGTIIEDKGYLNDPQGLEFIEGAIPAMKMLSENGFKLILVTNQSGIGRNIVTLDQLKTIHDKLAGVLSLNSIRFDEIEFCPHLPEQKCLCRKPNTGMAKRAAEKANIDLQKSYCIGDKMTDVEFAKKFGGKGVLIGSGYTGVKPDYIAKNLYAAAKWVISDSPNQKNSLKEQKKGKRKFLLSLILFFFANFAGISSVLGQPRPSGFTWRRVENNAFKNGEKLIYDVKWGLIVAGYAEMRLENIEEINNRKAFHLIMEAKSLPFFDVFYKARNLDESWIDVESICSHKYKKRQRESGYIKEETVFFDNVNKYFSFMEGRNGKCVSKKEIPMPAFTQDVLSALYYVRTLNLEAGKTYFIDGQSGDKTYSLKVMVYKKEKVSVPAGSFECYKIEPFVIGNGLFEAKGRLWIWVTADSKKLPVLLSSKIFIGSITAVLTKVEGN